MININTKTLFKLSLLSTALFLPACATSMANLSPIDIASNSVRRTDTLTGVSEIIGPSVKMRKSKSTGTIARAKLRTAGPFTDAKGVVDRNGTYLEVFLNYLTPTPNPQDARLYNTVNWPGGESALLAEFGQSVLDCRQDYRETFIPVPAYYGGAYDYYGYGYGYDGYGGHHDDDDDDDDTGDDPMPDTDDDPQTMPDGDVPIQRRRRRTGPVMPQPDGPGTEPTGPMPRRVAPQTASPKASKPIVSRRRAGNQSSSKPQPTRSRPSPRKRVENETVRELKYYPSQYNGGYRDVTVRYRCMRQENLRVFIPRKRLDAAEDTGLILYIRPQNWSEEKLVLPPNYVAGFKLAAYSPQGKQLTIPGKPVQLSQTARPKPEAAAKPKETIIYGKQ